MKKRILAGLLIGAMAFAMTACGSGSSSASSAASEAASSSVSAASEAASSSASEASEAGSSSASAASEAASSEATGESDIEYIKEKGTLTVGITDFAPMDYQEGGEWVGFDADLARKVAEDLGVEVEFIEIDWDNKIMELDGKSIDCVWNGMTLTDEVKKSMECTNAYCANAQVVVMPSDKAGDYQDVESLKELSFAVESGSAGEEAAIANDLEYTAVTAQSDTLLEVSSGTSDASIIDLLMAGAMIGEGTSYADLTHTVELTKEEYGIGCRKGSDLAAFINEELKKFHDDGSMMEIAEKYGVQEAVVAQ